jgi:hypothetical protein
MVTTATRMPKVARLAGKRSNGLRPLAPLAVDAIPIDSKMRALVVIPSISRRKHSKSNSVLIGK